MADIIIEKLNEVYARVHAEYYILQELSDYMTFEVPGARWHPKVKAKIWDGRMRLLKMNKGNTIYLGLWEMVVKFAKRANYSVEIDEKITETLKISEENIKKFVALVTPEGTNLEVRDYQYDAIVSSIQNQRQINLSCTGSGKSAIIYYLIRWYTAQKKKVLIIVPNVSLVEQLHSDFKDYSKGTWDIDRHVQKIYSGFPKEVQSRVVLSTWQSVYKQPKAWLNQFGAFIGDEAHLCQAASISSMMEKMTDVPVKIGMTGTIDEKNKKVHTLVLVGLFGQTKTIATSRDLIDRGYLSDIQINMISLNYSKEDVKIASAGGFKYQDEIKFIINHEKRNRFIRNLACSCRGVTLVLVDRVETHAIPLYEAIKAKVGDTRKVFIIHGDVEGEERELIRQIASNDADVIMIATFGTMSTGTNIPGIENIIFGSPSKSKIRNLQSIGRGLRKKEGKDKCRLFDIVDHISKKATLVAHGKERIKIYAAEGFTFKITEVQLAA